MKRRTLLKAAPAGLAVLAVGDAAEAVTETPVMALFREWMRLDVEETAAFATSDEEAQELATDCKIEIEARMRLAPKLTLVDVALTATACSDFGMAELGSEASNTYRAEARALVA